MTTTSDAAGKKLGMWLFLYTEIILFGGLFLLYAVYFSKYSDDFSASGKELSRAFGLVNTIILLVSSFAVAASITAIRQKSKGLSQIFLAVAIGCGLLFLINKYFEWDHKFQAGIYPNSEALTSGEPGRNIFFGLYYTITGLHGVHILIGLCLLIVCSFMIRKEKITSDQFTLLDNSGLYWHLVDLIWIYIFPLFYLIL